MAPGTTWSVESKNTRVPSSLSARAGLLTPLEEPPPGIVEEPVGATPSARQEAHASVPLVASYSNTSVSGVPAV